MSDLKWLMYIHLWFHQDTQGWKEHHSTLAGKKNPDKMQASHFAGTHCKAEISEEPNNLKPKEIRCLWGR